MKPRLDTFIVWLVDGTLLVFLLWWLL
jgi:hypothetical protein